MKKQDTVFSAPSAFSAVALFKYLAEKHEKIDRRARREHREKIGLFVVAVSFVLGACGGGGGDDPCAGVDCSLHGTCRVQGGEPVCDCDPGYISGGLVCYRDWCEEITCSHGTCEQDTEHGWCVCDIGWDGTLCDRCADGYHPDGDRCVADAPCDPGPCVHGTCRVEGDREVCDCDAGYTGPVCDQCADGYHREGDACVPDTADPCDPNPCQDPHKTQCIPQGDAYSCACDPGYQDNDGDGTCAATCATAGLDCPEGQACDDSAGTAVCVVVDPHLGTPTVDGQITEAAGDWTAAQRVGGCDTPTDWADNILLSLYVAYDDSNLYLGVQGEVEADNAIAVYLDTDHGPQSTGLDDIASATDGDGALDAALSAAIALTAADTRVDTAVGTKGMASVAAGLSDQAGWRQIADDPADFAWLEGTLAAGSGGFEASIPLARILGPGPWDGRELALFARIVNHDGQYLANQTLPLDDPAAPGTVSVVAVVEMAGSGTETCDHDGSCDPGETPDNCPDDCPADQCGDPDAFQWEDAVMYFVMVDRFFDADGQNDPVDGVDDWAAQYQGGDFAGVEAKLDYLQDLGVNTIWLSAPYDNRDAAGAAINPADDPHMYSGYHGYWPKPEDIDYSDPDNPDPVPAVEGRLGTAVELQSLIDAAHARGMKVLFDYVMNHVDIASGLYQAHPGWFVEEAGSFVLCAPDNWNDSYWGTRCAFTSYLPPFDFYQPDVRDWSVADALWWAKEFQVDGYRLDAIKHVPFEWLTELRAALNTAFPDPEGGRFYLVGETFEYDDQQKLKDYIDPATMLDGQFDFPLKKRLCEAVFEGWRDMSDLFSWMGTNEAFYEPGTLMTTWLGNHDIPRAVHFAARQMGSCTQGSDPWNGWSPQDYTQPQDAAPYERLGLAFGVLFTSPGVPLVYYGDEIGLAGGGDPDNRRMMVFDGLNTHQQALRDRVADLARIRAGQVALRRGRRRILSSTADTVAYRMTGCGVAEDVTILINRADDTRQILGLPAGSYTDLLTGAVVAGGAGVDLAARGMMILVMD